MLNELESARKKRRQKQSRKSSPDPQSALETLFLAWGPKALEAMLEEAEEEIIQAERDQRRRRERLKMLLEVQKVAAAFLDAINRRSPSPSA